MEVALGLSIQQAEVGLANHVGFERGELVGGTGFHTADLRRTEQGMEGDLVLLLSAEFQLLEEDVVVCRDE